MRRTPIRTKRLNTFTCLRQHSPQGGKTCSSPTHYLCPSFIQLTSLGNYWDVSSAMQDRRLILFTVYVLALTV